MFYTMRDINALARSKTFLDKANSNTVYVPRDKYIILDLQKKQMQINKNLDKSQRTYLTAVQLDNKVKEILRQRELAFKSVVNQQARINLLRALKDKRLS